MSNDNTLSILGIQKNFILTVADNLFLSLVQSLVIATIPILYFAEKSGDTAYKLIKSLNPIDEYLYFSLCAVLFVWAISYLFKIAKNYRPRIRVSNSVKVNMSKIRAYGLIIGTVRRIAFELTRCGNILLDTFIGLASAIAGIYIAGGIEFLMLPEQEPPFSPFCAFSFAAKFILIAAGTLALKDTMKSRIES